MSTGIEHASDAADGVAVDSGCCIGSSPLIADNVGVSGVEGGRTSSHGGRCKSSSPTDVSCESAFCFLAEAEAKNDSRVPRFGRFFSSIQQNAVSIPWIIF